MLGQTKIATDGEICDKIELAIKRLKAFERMIEERKKRGLGVEGCWSTPESVMKWWLEEE